MLCLSFTACSGAYGNIKLRFHASDQAEMGIFHVIPGDENEGTAATDNLLTTLPAGHSNHVTASDGDSFAVRSGDFDFRAVISVEESGEAEQPYRLRFDNAMSESDMELKHEGDSDDEFIWIQPGHHIAHTTGPDYDFVLRNGQNAEMIKVTIDSDKTEL